MNAAKRALVLGAGGFIGGHLVVHLLTEGYDVYGVDIKEHEYLNLRALGCKFLIRDLRDPCQVNKLFTLAKFDELYQLAADMGGASYIFSGDNDADIMHNSATINLNVLDALSKKNRDAKIFYSSSACIYPERNQLDPLNPVCSENSAYPAAPDSEYGWEKLFSERLYLAYARNKDIDVRIARFHNIFGPQGTWRGGKEKAPAAICRKIAETQTGNIEIWGDGEQTRSFLYINECIDGVMRLMKQSEFIGPVNIGSSEMVSINELVTRVAKIANKNITISHIAGPLGVRGRCSDNNLIKQKLNWSPSRPLNEGLEKTYIWVQNKVSE
jgi:GDP-D-mannose 3',5'-epimerase